MHYEFDSIDDFVRYLEHAPVNKKAFTEKMRVSIEKINKQWFATDTFAEAVALAKYGNRESFVEFQALKIALERFLKMSSEKTAQHNDYIGYVPDVKGYLEGHPLTMFNKTRPQRRKISVYFNSANLVEVTTNQIYHRGVIVLSMIEMLESMGYNVELNVFSMSRNNDKVHYANFKMKLENEKLNMQKLFFPMCHPSWFRRLIFNLREKTPDITGNWAFGYGSTCTEEDIRDLIALGEDDIVISRPDEMGILGEDILQDAANMFAHIDGRSRQEELNLSQNVMDYDGDIVKKVAVK